MNDYRDKEEALDNAKRGIGAEFSGLHPVDRLDAYRELGKHANAHADLQEGFNDLNGVPERPQDIERAAIDGTLDGGR